MMRNFKYSWQQLAKASFVGIATTATFYLAKTTGLFSSWLSTEELPSDLADSKESLSMSFPRKRESTVEAQSLDSRLRGNDKLINAGQRRLLQQSGVTVANPMPDQVIDANVFYSYSLDSVFSGNFSLLSAVETGEKSLPSWLNLQYRAIGIYGIYNAFGGTLYDVAVSGNIIYLADYYAGLVILNASIIDNIQLIGNFTPASGLLSANVVKIAESGNTVFMASSSGLQIVDVSNPTNPRLLSTYAVDSYVSDVAISNNTLFAIFASNLTALDITNASNPKLLGTYFCFGYSLTLFKNNAFITDVFGGLHILNISNPGNMQLVNNLSVQAPISPNYGCDPARVSVSGDLLFRPCGASFALLIYNISNLSVLSLVGSYSLPFSATVHVVSADTTVFLSAFYSGLLVLDANNPNNTSLLGMGVVSGFASGSTIVGNKAFVIGSAGLTVFDMAKGDILGTPPLSQVTQRISIDISARNLTENMITDIFSLTLDQLPYVVESTLRDQSIFPGQTLSLNLNSELLFTNPLGSFLQISINCLNCQLMPSWFNLKLVPVPLSRFSAGIGQAYSIALSGDTVFVADGAGGLQIIDVANPLSPQLLSNYSATTGADDIAVKITVSNSTVFMACFSAGLKILDVTNLSNPRLMSTIANVSSGKYFRSVAVSDNKAYVGISNLGLQIIDVSNSTAPILLGSYSDPSAFYEDIVILNMVAYLADGEESLTIIDVRNATNPTLLGKLPIIYTGGNGATGVKISGKTAFVASNMAGLQIADLSNITTPRLLGNFSVGGDSSASDVAFSGKTVFIAYGLSGLQIVDVSDITKPVLVGSYHTTSLGGIVGLILSGNKIFVADSSAGLLILGLNQWQLTLSPSVGDVGNYRVQLVATDNLGGSATMQPFTIRVEGPPQFHGNISAQLAKVGQAFNYFVPQGLVTDPNFDSVVFSAKLINGQPLPSWLNFNALSATFAGTPPSSAVGNMTILLSVTDNIAGSVNTTFTVMINHIPVVNQRISDQLMGIGLNNSFSLLPGTFTHPDNLPLVYSAKRSNGLSLPTWLLFNNISQIFTGQPNITDAGIVSVQVIAADSIGGQVSTIFTLHVDNFPQVSQPILASSAAINVAYQRSVANSFVDDDGDVMTYQASLADGSLLPVWLSFNAYAVEFSGTPSISDLGTVVVRLSATDSWGGRTDQLFNLSVVYPPSVGVAISQQVACADQPFQFVVPSNAFVGGAGFGYSARQSDGQTLPAWLNLDGITGRFSGRPTSTDAEQITMTLFCGGASTDFNLVVAAVCPSLRNPVASRTTNVNTPFALTLAGDTFDNGGMALTLSAERADDLPLPNWLSFNPSTGVLAGVPLATDVGMQTLQFVATNPEDGQGIAPFNLTVCYFPSLTTALPTVSPLRAQRAFALTIPAGTFTSQTGGALQYQVQQADGSALPSWLAFNASQLTLAGTPGLTDLGNFNLQIRVSESACGPTIAPLSLVVQQNYPPEVVHPLANQVASVGVHFVFFAPTDIFTDKNNDKLSYTATQSNGHSLPSWLKFAADTLSFTGTPGRGDTGDLGDKILTIALIAHDDKSQTAANFNIDVTGTSNLLLFIKIAVPIFSVLTTAITLYLQRGRVFNHCKPQRYHRLEDCKVVVGEEFKYQFETPKEQIVAVRVRIPKENKGCCRLFQLPRQALPGNTDLPIWMEYNPETNIIRSKGPVPNTKWKEMFVQVKGSAERTLEQFTLRVEQPALSEEAIEQPGLSPKVETPASSSGGDVEMQTLQSSTLSMS